MKTLTYSNVKYTPRQSCINSSHSCENRTWKFRFCSSFCNSVLSHDGIVYVLPMLLLYIIITIPAYSTVYSTYMYFLYINIPYMPPNVLLRERNIETNKSKRMFHFDLSFVLSSFYSLTHDSKIVRDVRTVCTPKDCSSIRDFPFVSQRLASYGSKHTSHAYINHFVCTFTHNSKTEGRIRTLYPSDDCSTIGNSYFLG